MFHNTTGGQYEEIGKKAMYTFPKGAFLKINDVAISLSDITVECHGDNFDNTTTKHFTTVSSLLKPKEFNVYSTDILIADADISEYEFPSADECKVNNINYMSRKEYLVHEKKTKEHGQELTEDAKKIYDFVIAKNERKRKTISDQIRKILNTNNDFPKHISLLYDNQKNLHTSHIVLSFQSHNECILQVSHSISTIFAFQLAPQVQALGFNPHTCVEQLSRNNPCAITFRHKHEDLGYQGIILNQPIMSCIVESYYKRMMEMIQALGFKITKYRINASRHNQKNTNAGVVIAIQNKLDYESGNEFQSNEDAIARGVRFRAEQAILSYLLTGNTNIPRNDEFVKKIGYKYDDAAWYPNASVVFEKLKESIRSLSFNEMKKLYLSLELDGSSKLSQTFSELLLSEMKKRLPDNEYKSIADNGIDEQKAEMVEKIMAPVVFYNKDKRSLFISTSLMFSAASTSSSDAPQDKNYEEAILESVGLSKKN